MTGVGGASADDGREKMLSGQPGAIYTAVGQGIGSCGAWTSARHERAAADLEQWILGFLSGVGFDAVDGTDPLRLLGTDVVFAWIDNYCSAHPLDPIVNAAAAFVSRGTHPVLTLH